MGRVKLQTSSFAGGCWVKDAKQKYKIRPKRGMV